MAWNQAIGYLQNTEKGLSGQTGLFYDYILARNGLFIWARSPLFQVTVCIAPANVRGLLPLNEEVFLPQGKIPQRLYDLALSILATTPERERYLAVTWSEIPHAGEDGYRLREPPQSGEAGSVKYERLPNTFLDIHSHGTMGAFFSGADDQDEQGLGLYMVAGKLDALLPEVELRVGVYGYFAPLLLEDVFQDYLLTSSQEV